MMLCVNPFRKDGQEFGCGQCLPCRINRARLWTGRILLESKDHPSTLFVTLTYDDEHLPGGLTLVPRHMQLFLKRLRFRVSPLRFRFYYCGEYGELTKRPHYHAILFGLGLEHYDLIKESWKYGFTSIGPFSAGAASYVAGYVNKGLKSSHPDIGERHPEFSRMSLRPAIGLLALQEIGEGLATTDEEVLPRSFRISGRDYPFGKYLQRKLNEEFSIESDPQSQRLELFNKRLVRSHELGSVHALVDSEAAKRKQSGFTADRKRRFARSLKSL